MSKYINKVSLTIAIIILFVPTIIGFIYINSNDGEKTPLLPEDASYEISVTDGTETEKLGDVAISLVKADLNLSNAVIDTSMVDRNEDLSYMMKVTVSRNGAVESKSEYVCYITNDVNKCYFVKDEVLCKFSPATAKEFLKLPIFQKTITYVKAPAAVYLKGEERITLEHTDLVWKYINVMGDTVSNDDVNASASQITINYPKGSILQSEFDFGKVTDINSNEQSPKEVYIQIETDELKYDKITIDEFDAFIESEKINKDTKFNATLEVVWGNDDMSMGFVGKHTYKFYLIYDIPAEFEVSLESIYGGALPIVKVKNLDYGAEIVATVTHEDGEVMDTDLNFMKYNDVYLAFWPFDFTSKVGKYTLKLSDGNVEWEYVLSVSLRSYETKNITLPAKLMSEHYGESKKISFKLTMEDVLADISEEKLWSGKFTAPLKIKLEKTVSYGEYIKLNVENEERAYCNTYLAPADTAVVAVNKGKVVYAGEMSITGKLIVIEHGYGLKSWYWNLGNINVKVGDIVEKSSKIGTVGSSGLCDETQTVLSFAMSADGVYFKPELFFNSSLRYFDR